MMLKELLRQPDQNEIRRLKRSWKKTLQDSALLIEKHPEHKINLIKSDLFNLAHNAVGQRNEKLLDEIAEQHEQLAPGDERFSRHIKFQRAKLRISERKFEEGIQIIEELLPQENPTSRSHHLIYLIECYAELKRYEQAVPHIYTFMRDWDDDEKKEKAYVTYSGLPDLLQILGMAGKREEVIRIGKEILDRFKSDDAYVLFLVGQSYLEMGDDLRALQYFTPALKLNSDFPEIYLNLGAHYWNKEHDYKKAVEYMEKALEACGETPEYQRLRAMIYSNLAKFSREILDIDQAGEYRRKQFEAMDDLIIFDLLAMFGGDEETMSEYKIWAENNPEAYDKYFDEEDMENQDDEDEAPFGE